MSELSPSRVAAFLAIAGVLVLIGWNSLRAEEGQNRGTLSGASSRSTGPDLAASAEPTGSGPDPPGGLQLAAGGRRIVVDVSGAVRRPGVYRFDHGQRVIDAIERAGGPSGSAMPAGINRAAVLADGQQVVVPSRVAAAAPAGAVAGLPGTAAADSPISLGSATQEQLEQIEGIGPVTAQSILEFRDSQGGVSSVDELDQVSGIGPVTMEALRSRLQP